MKTKEWFQVDRRGLARLLEKKGKAFALFELVQNAWDESGVTGVTIRLEPEGHGTARLIVSDNAPNGFADLTHAYTLFADSKKKGDATKRGRFNLGEKLFLSLCNSAEVVSTTGGVRFDNEGRHSIRSRRSAGSEINAVLRMTKPELAETVAAFHRLIRPAGIVTALNGVLLEPREPLAIVEGVRLATEIADGDGNMTRTIRNCSIEVYEPRPDEPASLYEMGIPVLETGDRWHVNITQKVPLTMDRENVPPAFLRDVRAAVLNAMAAKLTQDDAASKWATDAVTSDAVEPAAVVAFMDARFGTKRVGFDPSDPEANKLAVSEGYTVVTGGMLPGKAWQAVKAASAILPAGQVTPSPKPFSEFGTALPDYTPSTCMQVVERHAISIALHALGKAVRVRWTCAVDWPFLATCGPDGTLTFNVGRLGKAWFDLQTNRVEIDALIIHEFGHLYSGDHLSREYYDALCRIGALYAKACREGKF